MSDQGFRKHYKETGKSSQACGGTTGKPSKRFYAEGGFVKTGNMAHTTHGAPRGYANKVGKCK